MGESVPVNLSGHVERRNGVCGDGGGNYFFVSLFLSNGLNFGDQGECVSLSQQGHHNTSSRGLEPVCLHHS